MDSKPWHVLHVLSNHEKHVKMHLQARALEHYLPLYSEHVKWTDRSVVTERPLFPGYVFVRFPPQNRLLVLSVPGVLRHLGDEEYNMVSCRELDRIRVGLADGLLLRPHPCVEVGRRVRVRHGVFAGAEGIVKELRQQCKVILTLFGVGQCFSLEVEAEALELITSPVANPARRMPPFDIESGVSWTPATRPGAMR